MNKSTLILLIAVAGLIIWVVFLNNKNAMLKLENSNIDEQKTEYLNKLGALQNEYNYLDSLYQKSLSNRKDLKNLLDSLSKVNEKIDFPAIDPNADWDEILRAIRNGN